MTATFGIRHNIEITKWDASTPELEQLASEDRGHVLDISRMHNLVVLSGRDLIRDFLYGDSPSGITYIDLGTSSASVVDSDIAIGASVLRAPITSRVKASSAITFKFFLSTTALNGLTLTEAGLFNSASGATMFARSLLEPVIVKDISNAYTLVWAVTLISI